MQATVKSGADVLAASQFAALKDRRVGLITNQTGLVGEAHIADLIAKAPGVKLAAILAPEHGFRGRVEAGETVSDEKDERTDAPVFSLYGSSKKPSPAMLRGLDVLVFDIQDIGARFYTYISTMGLAMQAAAEARLPFVVLDRPNPLNGNYVSGFTRDPGLETFVGQYPIPIVHGMTVAELARMIQGEKWLKGLDGLKLEVAKVEGWSRAMRWPATGRKWVPTSPNIPTFESALVYPGIGVVGELEVNEGRGTATPFSLVAAPWIDGARLAADLNALKLPGVLFEATSYTPKPIPHVAAKPRFANQKVSGVRVAVTDVDRIEPLEIGMHMLAAVMAQARAKNVSELFPNMAMFNAISGTRRLHRMLTSGDNGRAIIAAWQPEVAAFKQRRTQYLLY